MALHQLTPADLRLIFSQDGFFTALSQTCKNKTKTQHTGQAKPLEADNFKCVLSDTHAFLW